MFCPKCGTDNPETGKFCRTCGTDLGNVSDALSGKPSQPLVDRKGRALNWESSIATLFMGLAFLAISIILGATGRGQGWWYWMLIPAFGMIGSGVAKFVQLKKHEQARGIGMAPAHDPALGSQPMNSALPPAQTPFVGSDRKYQTGDLVPPSVTDHTTRKLEVDKEGQTMTLPKEL